MTIDERLEALTQSLELLASMHRDEEQRGDERFTQVTEMAKRTDERFAQVTHNFEIVLDSIKRLERIALAHEDRTYDHQDRIEDLEGPK